MYPDIQHARHVEAEDARDAELIALVIEEPTALIGAHPTLQARQEIALPRPNATAQESREGLKRSSLCPQCSRDRIADDLFLRSA
jgi:hypothetical protein